MREAESQDVDAASAGGREPAARRSNVGVNFAGSDDADQEGVTLVDRDRVAMALRELRALGLTPSRVPDDGQAHESPPPPPSVGPIAGTSGLVAALEPAHPRLGPSRERKGQPSGILIAGVAVLVVALGAGAGAWSTRSGALVTSPFGREANSRGVPSADRPQPTLRGPISAVAVQAPLAVEAPPAPKAVLLDPAPSSSPPPSTAALLVPSTTPPRNHASALRSKARTVQRQAPNSANRRTAVLGKAVTARLRSSHATATANPPQIRIPEARHQSADPDATLPISE